VVDNPLPSPLFLDYDNRKRQAALFRVPLYEAGPR